MSTLTQARLMELFTYSRESGRFTRIAGAKGKGVRSEIAGSLSGKGGRYLTMFVDGKSRYCHRMAWLYCFGSFPDGDIDHIDGDGNNNKISNLRDVSKSENSRNQKKSVKNTSGFTGVCWDSSLCKWRARITVMRKTFNLGVHKNISDAVIAREKKEVELNFHPNHGVR